MKVLVLGGAGYIGSVLCNYLQEKGDSPVVFDSFLYERSVRSIPGSYEQGDIRNINSYLSLLEKSDAVVNLAAISNDPATDLQPKLSWDVNYKANETISELCQATHKRVVYASSCSVYGFSKEGEFNEESKLGPVTLYARTKMLSEKWYLHDNVDSVVLRFATVYGHSPKPRFDLVVNTMVGSAYFTGKINVNGGDQWRPVVHVKDVARAIYTSLHSQNHKHRVYNVGSNDQNYRIEDLANTIHSYLPHIPVTHNKHSIDGRSYKVNFDRITHDLGFTTKYSIKDAVDELYEAFKSGSITNMSDDMYYRVKYLKKYTRDGEPKQNFFGKYYSKIINLI